MKSGFQKKYFIRFMAGMLGYAILFGLSMSIIDGGELSKSMSYALAVLPLIPFLVAMSGAVAGVKELDELHKRIHLEAVIIASCLVGALALTVGLLEANELIKPISMIWVTSALISTWGVSALVLTLRYR